MARVLYAAVILCSQSPRGLQKVDHKSIPVPCICKQLLTKGINFAQCPIATEEGTKAEQNKPKPKP